MMEDINSREEAVIGEIKWVTKVMMDIVEEVITIIPVEIITIQTATIIKVKMISIQIIQITKVTQVEVSRI
jgi:hypothetical protein